MTGVAETVVGLIIVEVGRKALGHDELVKPLSESVGRAIGETFKARVNDALANRSSQRSLESCLQAALVDVERNFPAFVKQSSGFSWQFLESEAAAGELARSLLVGQEPNVAVLVDNWAHWLTRSGSGKDIDRRRAMAVEPMRLLVSSWTARVRALEHMSGVAVRSHLAELHEDVRRLTALSGASSSDESMLLDYLRSVALEHSMISTTGTGAGHRQIPLSRVFVSLSAVPDQAPTEQDRIRLDETIEHLEAKLKSEEITYAEVERELETLGGRLEQRNEASSATGLKLDLVTREHEKIVLLGRPGSGKTTMLRWLALQHSTGLLLRTADDQSIDGKDAGSGNTPVPIYLRVGSLVDIEGWKGLSLEDYIFLDHKVRSYPNAQSMRDVFGQLLRQGRCLILLDAVDEVPSEDDRRDIAKRLNEFARLWLPAGNRFVATSRSSSYRTAPIEGFSHFELENMNRFQVAKFLEGYCFELEKLDNPEVSPERTSSVALGRAARVLRAIDNNKGVSRLAENPLLLTILVLVQRDVYDLPTKRAGAFQKAVEALERGWRVGQQVDQSFLPNEHLLKVILAQLAWWIHAQRPSGIVSFSDILDAIGPRWAEEHAIERLDDGSWPASLTSEIDHFIQTVIEHCGLLVERAPSRWAFLHQTFQEYYVARYLLGQPTPAAVMRDLVEDARYNEPILLALGIATHVEGHQNAAHLAEGVFLGSGPFMSTLAESKAERVSLPEPLWGLAWAAAVDDVRLPASVLDDLVQSAVWWVRNGEFSDRRLASIESTGDSLIGRKLALQLQALVESNAGERVRRPAAKTLLRLGGSWKALSMTFRWIAENDFDHEMRGWAATELGGLVGTDSETLQTLTALATSDRSGYVRMSAISALGLLDPEGAQTSDVIRSIAEDASDPNIQRWAQRIVARYKH